MKEQKTAKTAQAMISGMQPSLRSGSFVFVSTDNADLANTLIPDAISVFLEDEGMSLLIPVDLAEKVGLNIELPMRCITLKVYSALEGTGLTSAVSGALADHNIPCNMVAAFHHDHVFVPEKMSEKAMQVLIKLQSDASEPE